MADHSNSLPHNGFDYWGALKSLTTPGLYEAATKAKRRNPRIYLQGDYEAKGRRQTAKRTNDALLRDFYQRWRAGKIIAFGYLSEVPAQGAPDQIRSELLDKIRCKNTRDSTFQGPGQIWYLVRFYNASDVKAWRWQPDVPWSGLTLGEALYACTPTALWDEFRTLGGRLPSDAHRIAGGPPDLTTDAERRCKEIAKSAIETLWNMLRRGALALEGFEADKSEFVNRAPIRMPAHDADRFECIPWPLEPLRETQTGERPSLAACDVMPTIRRSAYRLVDVRIYPTTAHPDNNKAEFDGLPLRDAILKWADRELVGAAIRASKSWSDLKHSPAMPWEDLWETFCCVYWQGKSSDEPVLGEPLDNVYMLEVWKNFTRHCRSGDPVATAWHERIGHEGERRLVPAAVWNHIEPPRPDGVGDTVLHGGGRVFFEAQFFDAATLSTTVELHSHDDKPQLKNQKPTGRPGRPPMYDWDAFETELKKHLGRDDRPETIEAATHDMLAWCSVNWDKEPGASTAKKHIRPYWPNG